MSETYHEIVQELVDLIAANHWESDFERAIVDAQAQNVPAIAHA